MSRPGADTTILIVDDDVAMQRLLAKWLEGAGYQVRTASSGRAAIEEIEVCPPGVLITDWEMPEMDGLELCRWLRSRNLPRYIYAFLLTVRAGTSDIVRGLEAGADDFLKKPVDRNELLARMRSGTRVLELEMRLSETARRDSLTGLLTQRAFFDNLQPEWSRSCREGSPLSCVMLDIDFFKRINDTHGHPMGDRAIRGVASWLTQYSRSTDTVSRFGGEEFCVLLTETSEVQAKTWADRARQELAAASEQLTAQGVPFTVSFGVAERMDDTASPEQLVDMADQALLVAKRAGRNRVVGFQSLVDADLNGDTQTPSRIMTGVSAGDVMTPVVAGLPVDAPVERAAEYFLHFRLTSAPVVDHDGNLVGMLTEKELLENMLVENWSQNKVHDIMSTNVIWYEESAPLLSIYEFLCRVALRSVVIVNNRKPVGVISRSVILRWCNNRLMAEGQGQEPVPTAASDEGMPENDVGAAMVQTADAVLAVASNMRQALVHDKSAAIPCVIGGASRLQELVNDLLGSVRSLNGPGFGLTVGNPDDSYVTFDSLG